MSIFRPAWDNTFAPALRMYVRGGRLIGSVMQHGVFSEGEERIQYRALTLDWMNKATDYEEQNFDRIEAAIAHVEETVGDRNSK